MATGGDGAFPSTSVQGATAASSQSLSEAQQMLTDFWPRMVEEIHNMNANDFKTQELPLARIKKIMKLDEDVKMISAEAPVLFAKAAEMFICELSLRSWIHTEENKRRTLQKNDISQAVAKYDQFDFLIDIVPRDEVKPQKREESGQRASMMPDQVQYYFQLAQNTQNSLQQQTNAAAAAAATATATSQAQQQQQTIQIQTPGGQVLQQPLQIQQVAGQQTFTVNAQGNVETPATQQVVQVPQQQAQPVPVPVPQPQQTQQTQQATTQQQQQQQTTTQVFQQVVSPSGEVQTIPISLNQAQLQAITLQMQGKQPGQSIVVQTGAQQQAAQQAAQQQQQQAVQQADPTFQTQPIFQVGNINGQQVFIQQNADGSEVQEIADT